MNNKELLDYMKNSHEYTLMEMRLVGEDVKDHVDRKYGKRISRLEHWRTAIIAGCAVALAWLKKEGIL